MKKLLWNGIGMLVLILMIVNVGFGDEIWSLDFESAGGYTTSITEFTDGAHDYFCKVNWNSDDPKAYNVNNSYIGDLDSPRALSNVQGDYFFAGMHIDAEGASLPVELYIDDINISGYSGLNFSIYVAEDDDGSNQDWDATDYVHIEYDIDNSGTFTNMIWIESNVDDTNQEPGVDTDFDGTGDGTEITSTFTQFSKAIVGTGSVIDIKIIFSLDSGDEDIAIDNLQITGTATGGVPDPSNFSAATSSASQIDLSWTQNGNSDNVMVAWNSTNTFGTPTDGKSYAASDTIGGGGTIVYNGSNVSYSHTSLSANTAYYYKAWSVNGSTNYSSGVTANSTTLKAEPTNHITNFAAAKDSTYGHSRIDLSWTENDGSSVPDSYLIKASTTTTISDPIDGTEESDNTTIGDNSGAVNIAHGTKSYEWTGLDAEQTYYFKIYPYTNSGSDIDYKTDGTIPSGNATTDAAPVAPQSLMISEVADPSDDYYARFVEIYNCSGSSIDFSSETWYLCKQSNGGSWADIQLTGTLAAGDLYILAYNQSRYESTYSSTANIYNSNINGNGNDGYYIFYYAGNADGVLVDSYGVIDTDGTGELWEYEDSHAVRKSSATIPNTTWTASEWTIEAATAAECGPTDTSLPVTLSSFTATAENGVVKLAWITSAEIENLGFNIYRKTSDGNFAYLTGFAQNSDLNGYGTTSEFHNYSFTDNKVEAGKTYTYLLADVDYNMTETKHNDLIKSVTLAESESQKAAHFILGNVYPNPFNPSFTLPLQLNEASQVRIQLYNMNGRKVKTLKNDILNAGDYSFTVNATDLSSGIYIIKSIIGNKSNSQKVVLMK